LISFWIESVLDTELSFYTEYLQYIHQFYATLTDTRERMFAIMFRRTIVSDVVQGIIIGGVLAFITAQILMNVYVTTVNGWRTIFGCGEPGNSMLFKAACANKLPAVNVPKEAMYWTATKDGAHHKLNSQNDYILHFPAGGLPPNNAFWSLTMGDAQIHFVANPINRYSVGDRSGLAQNADGSVDIYIQNTAPAGHESNWLPALTGKFILWLRVYIPVAAVLDGEYTVPPVSEVKWHCIGNTNISSHSVRS